MFCFQKDLRASDNLCGQSWWQRPRHPAIQEVEVGGSLVHNQLNQHSAFRDRAEDRRGRNDPWLEAEVWKDHGRMKPSPPEQSRMQLQTEFLFLPLGGSRRLKTNKQTNSNNKNLARAMICFNTSSPQFERPENSLCFCSDKSPGQAQVPACWYEGPIC